MRQGNRISTPYVWLYFLRRADSQSSRAATIVSKKVHQSAVKRHRYQRWLRSLADTHINRLPAAYDMVWVARPKIIEVNKIAKLQNSLPAQLNKLLDQPESMSPFQAVEPNKSSGKH